MSADASSWRESSRICGTTFIRSGLGPPFRRQQLSQLVGVLFQHRLLRPLEPRLDHVFGIPFEENHQFAPRKYRCPIRAGNNPRRPLHAPERADDSGLGGRACEYFCDALFRSANASPRPVTAVVTGISPTAGRHQSRLAGGHGLIQKRALPALPLPGESADARGKSDDHRGHQVDADGFDMRAKRSPDIVDTVVPAGDFRTARARELSRDNCTCSAMASAPAATAVSNPTMMLLTDRMAREQQVAGVTIRQELVRPCRSLRGRP